MRNIRLMRCSDPAEVRTQDPYIKSVLLYQLSYRVLKGITNLKNNLNFNITFN
jgi:hypothetical protein